MAEESNTAAEQLEIIATGTFNVTPDQLFEMFSSPAHLAQWWGPEGFTNTFHEFAFEPGGAWRFVMHGPDGTEYAIENRFEEIMRPERIVVRHIQAGHGFQLAMTFKGLGSGTILTWNMLFDPGEADPDLKEFITHANEQNLGRLRAYLASTAQ
jgi:uncharacterized protein YndB with AHSA1/START domain